MSMPLLTGLAALAAFCLALIVCANAWRLGSWLRLLDVPDGAGGRKRHEHVTPLVGGLAIAGATVLTACAVASFTSTDTLARHFTWLALVVAAMFAIGVADDRFHLSPVVRLALTVAVLLVTIEAAPDFSIGFLGFAGMDSILLGTVWGGLFTLVCLVGLLNAVNMADGKNGIVAGMGLIWSLALARHASPEVLPVLAAAGAALAVIWVFNMRGRLFLGDGGSYSISALFGLLAIYSYNHAFDRMPAGDVAVLFAIPVFDTVRLMATRAWQGRSPFEGDRDHLHHHLHAAIGWPRGLWVYLGIVALPNVAALVAPGTSLRWLLLALLLYLLALSAARQPETRAA